MMWRFWFLLSAVLLVKDAGGRYVKWDSVAWPKKVNYPSYQPEEEDFSSSVVAMESSSVVSEQDMKFGEDDQSNWASSSQQGFSEVVTGSESAGPYRTVVQYDPGDVSETHHLGSVETWSFKPNVALETPELSSSLFEQGHLYQGSSGVWVPRESVQSGLGHQGPYRVPSPGQSTRPPHRGLSHPHPQGPQHGRPFHSRPRSKAPAFLPQMKSSLSSLASENLGVGSARDPQKSSRRHPPWVEGKWQPSSRHSEMWGSGVPTTSYLFNGDDARKKHGFRGPPYSHDMHKGQHSGLYRPWEHSQTQLWGSGVPTTYPQTDWDDAHKRHRFPGHPHTQDMHKGHSSGPYHPSGQTAQSQLWGSHVTSSHPSGQKGQYDLLHSKGTSAQTA
ncbi:uncharacterized protein LOC143521077 isoform X2 [Brachyhypopomus gauderio]|uniref:uncharacterized protein LOC143521077 isoform X2 n=1 Tax=Brachyhypopomus gauderio TaxID=698409 RepID=UPI0040422484